MISEEKVQTTIQSDAPEIKTAYKLDRENCKINFSDDIEVIYNLIRGLSPYPSAYCDFVDGDKQWNVKIYEVEKVEEQHNISVGIVVTAKKEIKIAVSGGFLKVKSLQFPGKKRMTAQELLNGMSFSEQTRAV